MSLDDQLREEDLNQFHGTSVWYQHWMNQFTYTEGVKYVADKGEAHWLLDAIASYQVYPKIRSTEFQFWTLAVELEKRTGLLTMQEDEGAPLMVNQTIPHTDFPLKELKLYLTDRVLLLPGEY